MGKLTIQDLVSVLTDKNELDKKEALRFLSNVFDLIQEGVERDKLVKVKGLGTFKVVGVEARESVNVNTGERVMIDSHLKVTFLPDTIMKELVNKPFSGFETVVLNEGVDFDDIPMPTETPETDEWQDQETSAAEDVLPAVEEPITEAEEPVTEIETVAEEPVIEEPVQVPAEADTTEEPPVEEETPVQDETEEPAEQPVVSAEEPSELEEETSKPVDESTELEDESAEPVDEFAEPEDDSAEPVDEPEEPVNNSDEPADEPSRSKGWIGWLLLALLACAISFAAGYYLGQRQTATDIPANQAEEKPENLLIPEKDSVISVKIDAPDTLQTVKTDTTVAIQAEAEVQQPTAVSGEEWKVYEAKDARVRTGAYRIVGTAQVVKVREGDTPARVSRRYLGEGMSCYLEVYNDINASTPLKAGQDIKIPKLELKKKRKSTNQ